MSSDVLGYEIQYNFTIRECPGNSWNVLNVTINDGSLRKYTLVNTSDTPVEEDSDYFLMFSAVNSDGKSEPTTTETNTSAAGIQMCTSRVCTRGKRNILIFVRQCFVLHYSEKNVCLLKRQGIHQRTT